MNAAINSNTSVLDYMSMPVLRFYDTWQALCALSERRAEERNQQRAHSAGHAGGRPRRRKR